MVLARMIVLDEEAIICDLAQTYHILNYRELPASLVAVLCCGLNEDSRIKIKLSDRKVDLKTILLASMVDKLALILWKDTDDARNNINRPISLIEELYERNERDFIQFNSFEEFEEARKQIIGG